MVHPVDPYFRMIIFPVIVLRLFKCGLMNTKKKV